MASKSKKPTQSVIPRQPPPKQEANYLNQLITMIKELKLNEDPEISDIVNKICIKGDNNAAKKWVMRLSKDYNIQRITPNPFLSIEEGLEGEFLLGHKEDGKEFGIDRVDLVRHTFCSGQAGTGKSNLLKYVLMQAKDKGVHCIHIDRKGDLIHAVKEGLDCISWPMMRINPLCPGDPRISVQEYRNDFSNMFSELMGFWQRGLAVFLIGMDTLYKNFDVYDRWPSWNWDTMEFPTLIDLLELFKDRDFAPRVKGYGKESLYSIIEKLESIIIELEPVVSCQRGFDIERFYREKKAINYVLDGVSVNYQNFLIICIILHYAHYFKNIGPWNQLNALMFFDESKGLLGEKNQDKFIIKDLVAKIREWGIGLFCADQIPSEISQFFFSNIGTLIMFRHSDGNDLAKLQRSSGATYEQMRENYSLKPGDAIVRTMKCKDLHKIKVPFTPVNKFITRSEVEILMAPELKKLYEDVIPYTRKVEEGKARVEKPKKGIVLYRDEREFLEYLAINFDKPSTHIYKGLGWTGSKGHGIKDKLVAKNYITVFETNLGKGGKAAKYLVPNPIVFEKFGIDLGSGRGGAFHKHFQSRIKSEAERLGYSAIIEESHGGSREAPDVGLEKDMRKVAVEICVTSKPSHEAKHIEKNLKLGFNVVILTFISKDAMKKTEERASQFYQNLDNVKFCIVSDFLIVLREL